jgi:hypothetical protein
MGRNVLPRLLPLALGLAALGCAPALAVTCTTQAEMKEADRNALAEAARDLGAKMQSGNVDAVKAKTIASVAANFDGIAGTIRNLSPDLAGATLRVTNLYALDASNATPGQDEVQFFCGQAANTAHVSFAIPQLPPGRFAFAVVEATGVKSPQRLAMLLQDVGGSPTATSSAAWQLAGFFPRPLLAAGHDGVWYWQKARDQHKAGRNWNAYFYYQTAQYLLQPADFLSSGNLEKLTQEETAAMPAGLPGPTPMLVTVGGSAVKITNLHTDSSFGGLDLVISYDAADVSDPVKARQQTVALMKAMLAQHPELKDGFHGLWVFANAPDQRPFALELPMAQIDTQS